MQRAGEPSVEDILQSIKRVIARENSEVIARTRTPPSPAPEPRNPLPDPIEDEAEEDDAAQADPAPAADPPLLTPSTRASMRDSLATLAMLAEPGAPPRIVRSGETSLEMIVREMLRPMLAEWLDHNLPAMVEKLVAAEIARIVGKKA